MAAITYKCPNCDGGLVFDPSSQKYHCEYCLSDFTQEELECLSQELVRRTAGNRSAGNRAVLGHSRFFIPAPAAEPRL